MDNSYVYGNMLTDDEYTRATGVDLSVELISVIVSDTGDDPIPRFICGIEEWLRQRLFDDYNNSVKLIDKEDTAEALSDNYVAIVLGKDPSTYTLNTDDTTRVTRIQNQFKKATIAQIQYYLQNSTISNDSGYDVSKKVIIDIEYLNKISMAPDAKVALRNAGLMNRRKC